MFVNVSSSSLLLHIYSLRKPETKSSLRDKSQNNTRIFLRPKKIHDRSLDPKKYQACKFSTQKNTSDPPVMYTSSTPPPPPGVQPRFTIDVAQLPAILLDTLEGGMRDGGGGTLIGTKVFSTLTKSTAQDGGSLPGTYSARLSKPSL